MVGWFKNDKIQRTLKKAIVDYSEIPPRISLYGTDKSHEGSMQNK
jgi:hypothetical protein